MSPNIHSNAPFFIVSVKYIIIPIIAYSIIVIIDVNLFIKLKGNIFFISSKTIIIIISGYIKLNILLKNDLKSKLAVLLITIKLDITEVVSPKNVANVAPQNGYKPILLNKYIKGT